MFEEDREIEKSSQKKRILVGNSESLKKFRTMKGEKRRSKNAGWGLYRPSFGS
jgi:hypothetical protein